MEKTAVSNIMPNPDSHIDELGSLRRDMLKFAKLQLRDDASAEDGTNMPE